MAGCNQARTATAALSRSIDGRLFSLGDALGRLLANNDALSRRVSQLELVLADSGVVARAQDLFNRTAELAGAGVGRTRDLDGLLASIDRDLLALGAREQEFSEAVMVFWTLIISIRIEAARLTSDDRKEVLHLAAAMTDIYVDLKTISTVHFSRLDAVRLLVGSIRTRIEEACKANELRVADCRRHMDRILDSFQTAVAQVAAHQALARDRMTGIQRDFGEVVISMQFQDIIRQKLEGVTKALAQLSQRSGVPGDEQLAFTHFVTRVQREHIAHASAELGALERTLLERVSHIASVSSELARSTTGLREIAVQGLRRSKAASLFIRSVAMLLDASRGTSHIAHELHAVLDQVRAHVLEQVAALTQLGAHLRHVAINAQIVAARTTGGAALERLSAQTRGNSDAMLRATQAISSKVQAMVPRLEDMEKALLELAGAAVSEDAALQAEAETVQRGLGELTISLCASFASTERELAAGHEKIASLLPKTGFGADTYSKLDAVRDHCDALAQLTCRFGEARRDDPHVRERLRAMRLDYVMEAQRATHDDVAQLLGGPAPPAGPPTASTATVAPAGSGDDNIELF